MKKFKRSFISLIMVCVMAFTLCSCQSGQKSPDAISFQADGGDSDSLEVRYGDLETIEVTAVTDPEDFDGEITWESSDAGVVKIEAADGNTVTLKILKVGTAKITASCGDTSASYKVTVKKNQDNLTTGQIALTINGKNYSAEKANIVIGELYREFLVNYAAYIDSLGIDTSGGLAGLASQSCDYSDGGSWLDYFMENGLKIMQKTQALCDYADANGITLDDDDEAVVDGLIEDFESEAEEDGYADYDKYAAACFGQDATEDLLREYYEESQLATKAYNSYEDSLTYTDEEIKTHFAEMGYSGTDYDYPMVSMRHILIMAEADADGNYTDEAIQAAHDKAEEIYEEWKAGDATEDSFAELAEEYSEDTGSNTNGGLYENIYQNEMVDGINDFLFGDRKAGDTAVIDNNGSYVGTHVVYFVGTGEEYSTYLSVSDLKETDMDTWLTDLQDGYDIVDGAAYGKVADFD